MRTKISILSAAALAAGLASASAQVYSANVVGYYNVTVPANKFALIGNQLLNGSDLAKTNNDINVSVASGLVSDPNGPPFGSNSVYYQWTGTGYNTYYWFSADDGAAYGVNGTTAGWYDAPGNPAPVSLNQGYSAFLRNASSSPMTVTIVGTVPQGAKSTTIASGFGLYSLPVPVGTNADVAGFGLPVASLTSDPNGPPFGSNDQYYQWTGTGYNTYYWFNVDDGAAYGVNGAAAGFYDAPGNPLPLSSYPKVGEGFLIKHFGSAITWNSSFTVQ